MKRINVNYQKSLVSVSNSFIKYYGKKTFHNSLDILDKELDKGYKHVVLMLLDGSGTKILEKNLSKDDFLNQKMIDKISSVFPPTTVAATTSVTTGLTPIEHGWLGWHLYLSCEDPSLTLFTNLDYYQDVKYDSLKVNDIIGFKNFWSDIENLDADDIYPSFRENGYKTFNEALDALNKRINKDNPTFTYFYWDNPDALMHEEGTNSKNVKELIKKMNDELEKFYHSMNQDTLIVIVADHGQVDIEPLNLYEYQDILDCLDRLPSAEARATIFHVKENKKEEFEKKFNQYFSNDYMLFNKQEVLDLNIYGYGIPHQSTNISMGDYLAVSKTKKYFIFNHNSSVPFIGHHAGSTIDELEVPLIILSKK